MLCSKARLNWARDGNRNSKYFYVLIRDRRKKQLIQLELANGEISTEPSVIGRQALHYFYKLFSASPYHLETGLFENITLSISEEEDQSFSRPPTIDEVWDAIQQLNPSSSLGNDGFTG